MEEKCAHCFEGALFAAAALRYLGQVPKVVDLSAFNDDDHVIAIYRRGKFYGSVAKSNTTVLRFREPVYRSLRELVMSYFDFYFNTVGKKTLRKYSRPLDLRIFDSRNWMTTDEDLEFIGDYFPNQKYYSVLTEQMIKELYPIDPDVLKAGFMGALEEGLFKAKDL